MTHIVPGWYTTASGSAGPTTEEVRAMTDTPIADQAADAVLPAQRNEAGTDQEVAEEHAAELASILAEHGYATEDVTGNIFNVSDAEGRYLYTLTVTRTPGY